MKAVALFVALTAASMIGCTGPAPATPPAQGGPAEGLPPAERMQNLDALVSAYPDFLAGQDGETLVWKDGARMPISDGRASKTAAEIIDDPDIDDIFTWPYPSGAQDDPPSTDFDPGRARPYPFFSKMYGDCRIAGVKASLVEVAWAGGQSVQFTTVNGADKALERVARELETLGPTYAAYLNPVAGTFNCREIAGTERLSMHAFAAAIDLNTAYGDYWRWSGGDQKMRPYRNRIPLEIVRVFEKHGFIWGGRWAHFDTFHFEYRPELILAATRAQQLAR